jgi:hypothetical protein
MRLTAAFAWAVMLICVGVLPSYAEKRVALVIGNSAYTKVPRLPNPANDAAAIAVLLGRAGFDVVQTKTNLDLASMRHALRDFSDAARDADAAVVFFAGHGLEVNGTNYLIPVDAALERDIDVEDEAVSLERVSQIIEQAKRLRVVILDACRDNPFTSRMKRTVANRSIGRGLARVDVLTADTLIAFSAKAGSTASDGSGPNSPYASALLQHLVTPGLDLRLALGRVRDQVLASTGGKQEPFVYGSLGGAEVSLAPGGNTQAASIVAPPREQAAPTLISPPDPCTSAEAHWRSTEAIGTLAAYMDHLGRFSTCPFASLAKARIEALNAGARASVEPAPARASGLIFADSDRRYLTQDELSKLTTAQWRIARNEIFARKGRFFHDQELANHFRQFPWYKPYAWEVPLNAFEKANSELIQKLETGAAR